MKLDGTHHLTLTVTDLDRTTDWYRSVLGFEERVRYRNDAIGADCGVLADPRLAADHRIASIRRSERPRVDEHRIGLDHLAFDTGDEDGLKQWHAHLERLGVPYTTTRLPELYHGPARSRQHPDRVVRSQPVSGRIVD